MAVYFCQIAHLVLTPHFLLLLWREVVLEYTSIGYGNSTCYKQTKHRP